MRDLRVRPFTFALVGLPTLGVALALTAATAEAVDPFAATASVSNSPQYLGDAAGTAFTFTVTNTGSTTSIGAVEIERPSSGWSLSSCGTAPSGWAVQTADPKCRYRSTTSSADDILPGESRTFTIVATTDPGTVNRVGTWHVTVSKSNQFDNPSLLEAAEAQNGLQTTAYTWEVLDAIVSTDAVTPGSACPPSDKDELTSTTVTMVICGRNHATVALTPTAGFSSLSGTFLASPGVFSSGQIAANSAPVVVANWNDATVVSLPGQNLTVVATIGSAGNQTSPVTTLGGYEAINQRPIAANDAYSVAEDGSLAVSAPGVLDNDSDPENQPLTAQPDQGPSHAESFTLHADGSFEYEPVANYDGPDSFTYYAHDGIQTSASPATVDITVTAVNDAPVNTAPASVGTNEDTAYVFAPGALSVSDIDSGAEDVETTLSVADASVTVGTSDVTVTGNGTGNVVLTGPVSAVAAAIDGATLTPAANTNGGTTLTMTTSDLGNTGSGGVLTDTDVVVVDVTAVNDAPSFTPGDNQTVGEGAGAQTVSGWATAISAGPADESAQVLTFHTSTDNAGLFQTAPSVSASGTLTYTPDPNASGVANVTVYLTDNGGIANGGDDTSDSVVFTITVNAVNDPPTAADATRSAHTNMAVHVTGLLAGATDPNDAAQYTPSFTLTSVTPASCSGCGISNVNADGSFDFAPPAGQTGSFTLNYTVTDTGFPAPGVESAPATLTITVSGPVIWFVDPSVAGPGTGTLTDPFKALSSAVAVAGAGDRIFVSSGTVTGNVPQQTGGWLVGQGVTGTSFDSVFGITPPAGTAARPSVNGTSPTLQGGISVATNSVVRGLNVTPPSGTVGIAALGDNGVTVSEVGVTSTSARAVDVVGSQGVNVALSSVSSTGAINGIRLSTVNTTTPGSFSVAGGTIAGSTAEGVSASAVGGMSLSGLTVSTSNTHGILAANMTGSVSLSNVVVFGSRSDNARIFGSTGSVTVSVTNSVFRDNSVTTGNRGMLVQADGAASMTYTGSGNDFLRNRGTGLAINAFSSQKMTTSESGGEFTTNRANGVSMVSNGAGGLAYSVTNGTVTGCATCGAPINAFKATGATGTGANAMAGTISGMTVSNADSQFAPGIWVRSEGSGAHRVLVDGNTVSAVAHYGIHVLGGNGGSAVDATITNNDVTLTSLAALAGVHAEAGTLSGDTVALCADIEDNVLVSPTNGAEVTNAMAATTFRLPGYAGSALDEAAVELYLTTENPPSTANANAGTAGFTGGAACAAP